MVHRSADRRSQPPVRSRHATVPESGLGVRPHLAVLSQRCRDVLPRLTRSAVSLAGAGFVSSIRSFGGTSAQRGQPESLHSGSPLTIRPCVLSRTTGFQSPRSHTRDENAIGEAWTSTSYLWLASTVNDTAATPGGPFGTIVWCGSIPLRGSFRIVKASECARAPSFHFLVPGLTGAPSKHRGSRYRCVTFTSASISSDATGTPSMRRTANLGPIPASTRQPPKDRLVPVTAHRSLQQRRSQRGR
jgi:hypothetical protein